MFSSINLDFKQVSVSKLCVTLCCLAISITGFSQQYAKDLSFTTTSGINEFLQVCEPLPGGDMLIAGAFSGYNGQIAGGIARIHEDGSADTDFNSSGTGANNAVRDVVIQPDGKIIIAGDFTTYNGVTRNRIARLNADGTLDLSFDPAGGPSFWCFAVALQADGKILVGGVFDTFDGNVSRSLARLNPDGSFDNTFVSGVPANATVYDIQFLTDGQVLIAGSFTTYGGANKKYLVKLNPDGTRDDSFNTGNTGANQAVQTISLLPNGNILISGTFSIYNGTSSKFIAGLNPNGTLANAFADSDLWFSCSSVCPLPNGQLLAAGHHTSFNGTPIYRIVRYNADGSVDPTISMITANETITCLAKLPDDKILAGGRFTQFKGQNQPRIIRIEPCTPTYATDVQTGCNSFTWINGVNYTTSNNTATYTIPNAAGCDSVITLDLTIENTIDTRNVTACDSYFWPVTNQVYTISGAYSGVVSNPTGCDSLLTLQLVINQSSHATISEQACNSYTWPVTGQTYLQSGQYPANFFTSDGCDSIITLDLTITYLDVSAFVVPSDINSCTGAVYISASENPEFTFNIDGMPGQTSQGDAIFENLCPGIYSVMTTDGLGDTLSTVFVIPSDSGYFFNNPLDEDDIDSITAVLENCNIDFDEVNAAYIESIVFGNGDTLMVNWIIASETDTTTLTVSYIIQNDEGNYYVQLQLYCPEKSEGQYMVATEGVILEISTAGLENSTLEDIRIFPNPASSSVKILFDDQEAVLNISTLNGKLLAEMQIENGKTISLEDYSSGVYLFTIATKGSKVVKRVVKQ